MVVVTDLQSSFVGGKTIYQLQVAIYTRVVGVWGGKEEGGEDGGGRMEGGGWRGEDGGGRMEGGGIRHPLCLGQPLLL